MSIRLEGMSELRKALLTITGEGLRTAQREVLRSTLNVHRRAKELCPVDTGRLRNSIAFDLRNNGISGIVGTNVDYATEVEFGRAGGTGADKSPGLQKWMTRKGITQANHRNNLLGSIARNGTRAQPFLFPALAEEQPHFFARMRSEFNRAFVRAGQ
ncbi:MAG: hypothetical protein JWM27_4729 [Gemmatimonadetes bacterium]|nr:hypothetical protein [Gemmatimonadota bacterium]